MQYPLRLAPTALLLVLALAQAACGTADVRPAPGSDSPAAAPPAPKAIADVIPLTVGNLRGHRTLYREGWYVVSSSEKAFAYARQHSVVASRQAIAEALRDAASRGAPLPSKLKDDLAAGVETTAKVFATGSAETAAIFGVTKRLSAAELDFARRKFEQAASRFVQGNLALKERTADERRELSALPGRYFDHLSEDYANLGELADAANRKFAGDIEVGWDQAFGRAREEFRQEYERSGEAGNSLKALGPILYGYLKSIYHGLLAPSGRAAAKGTSTLVTQGVFRPTAYATLATGRTIEAAGLSLYYTGKAGIEIVSPTVEAGMLGGLSLLSLSTVPVTAVGGGAVGAVNQVAFTAAAPVVGTAHAAGAAAVDTAAVVGLVTYDAVKGTTRVVINQAQSGVVLGYNAVTAIPTHLLMSVPDAAIFLAWDGPRLVVAAASGELGDADGKSAAVPQRGSAAGSAADLPSESLPNASPSPSSPVLNPAPNSPRASPNPADYVPRVVLGDLPVGSVADLQKLRQTPGVTVRTLSDDPAVIGEIIRRLPCDLRTQSTMKESRCVE